MPAACLPSTNVEMYEISNVRSHYVLHLKEKRVLKDCLYFQDLDLFLKGLNEFM